MLNIITSFFGAIPFEQRDYTILRRRPGYEIRHYSPCVAARVTSDSLPEELRKDQTGYKQFMNAAFKKLAAYIGVIGSPQNLGSNEKEQKISMTAPVGMKNRGEEEKVDMTVPVRTAQSDGDVVGKEMSFFLPKKYRKADEAPTPTDKAVKIVDVPAAVEAVITFSWNANAESCQGQVDKLKVMMEKDGLAPVGTWSFNAMNPPFCIPFLKTNEVSLPVRKEDVDKIDENE